MYRFIVIFIRQISGFYSKTNYQKFYKPKPLHPKHNNFAFFLIGKTKIELLESTDPEGPIGKFLEKKGEGVHHIALAVENTNETLHEAESEGLTLIDKVARKGAEGLNIGFLHPKSTGGVLVEFCSKECK